jgi:hypothetical protein
VVAEHDDPAEPLDFLLADTDITLSAFFDPHLGQERLFSSADEKIMLSNIFLHFLHLNS